MKWTLLHKNNPSDFWIKFNEQIIHITEGTGDNLLKEDIQQGYVDYIYYDIYLDIQEVYDNEEYDGGMVLLKNSYKDFLIEEIVEKVINMVSA